MITLWNKHPEIPNGSIGWRMGYGEDYAVEFDKWFEQLDENEQDQFILENPEPEDWQGYYSDLKQWQG